MPPADHEELVRLRDRIHEVANACARQYAELQQTIAELRGDHRVTQEQVRHLSNEVSGMRRAVWTLVGTVLAGVIVYLLTQALGGTP